MKAISLTQPWASLVALGFKTIETRSWSTQYRGPIAIHAAKKPPFGIRKGEEFAIGDFWLERDQSGLLLRGPIKWPYRLPVGAVLATAHLEVVVPTDELFSPDEDEDMADVFGCGTGGIWYPAKERAYGDYTSGRFAWLLSGVQATRPVETKGSLGLWEWEVDVEAVS